MSNHYSLRSKKSRKASTDGSPHVAVSQLSGGLDPLQMPHVLENIFKFCPVQDLTSCRLVSRLWNDNSKKLWRSRVFVEMRLGRVGSPLKKFKNFIASEDYKTSGKPYRNYSLSGYVTPVTFWRLCGANIHVLELSEVNVYSKDFRRLVYTSCPNLKELILRSLCVYGTGPWPNPDFSVNKSVRCLRVLYSRLFQIPWLDLLTHFPSLQVLQISDSNRWNRNITKQVFEAVESIRRQDPNALQLKDIETPVADGMPPAFVRVLSDPDLPLEKIRLAANGADAEVKVRDIFWNNAATLKTIVLNRNEFEPDLDTGIIFPLPGERTLPKLEEISARLSVITSLDFLRWTPNLKKFAIDSINTYGNRTNIIQNTNWDEMRHVTMSQCTELKINWGYGEITANDVEALVRVFPNVERLTMPLNKESLPLVCEHWTSLNLLNAVHGTTLDESAITGLHPEDVEIINNNHDWRLVSVPRRPNITYLQSLRVLSLENSLRPHRPRTTLGHCAAIHGFLRLPNLQQLSLSNFKMKRAAKDFIQSRLDDFAIDH